MKAKKRRSLYVVAAEHQLSAYSFKRQVEGRVYLSESVFSTEPQTGDNGTNL